MQQTQHRFRETCRPGAEEFSRQFGQSSVGRMTQIYLAALFACALIFHSSLAISETAQSAAAIGTKQVSGFQSPAPVLSKFEARRIRHRCRDQVGKAMNKELRHCFEMHVAARRLGAECRHKAQTANLHGRDKDEAVKHCITEKLGNATPKEP
jgi:hypothetical protein